MTLIIRKKKSKTIFQSGSIRVTETAKAQKNIILNILNLNVWGLTNRAFLFRFLYIYTNCI